MWTVRFWNPYDVYVVVGSNYLNGTNAVVYQAIDLIVHAGFNSLLHIHDIGLIETLEDIIFNENVQPIALPTADRNFDNYPLFASGWGSLVDVNITSDFFEDIIDLLFFQTFSDFYFSKLFQIFIFPNHFLFEVNL